MKSHRSGGSQPVAIDQLENRLFLSASKITHEVLQEPVTIGGPGGLKTITFVAVNGRKTTFSIAYATAAIMFPVPAELTVYQGHGYFPTGAIENISSIVIANAIPGKASLREIGQELINPGLFAVPSIVGGNLGTLSLPDVNVDGSLTLGSVKQLEVGGVSNAAVNLGSTAAKVKVDGVLNGAITVGSIGALTAASISNTTITSSAAFTRSKLAITSIDGGAGILDSTITSAGSIGTIKAGYLDGTVVTAGMNAPINLADQFPSAQLPTSSLDIVAAASIKTIKISSKLITAPAYFSDSIIAAESLGNVQLGQINGGGGVAARSIGNFAATGPSGALDRFPFKLNGGQLKTGAKVQAALAKVDIPYIVPSGLPSDTLFYNFNLDILI